MGFENKRHPYIENGSICLPTDTEYVYDIDINRIKTHRDLLEWVHHLAEKNWVTSIMLREFIDVATSATNVKIW